VSLETVLPALTAVAVMLLVGFPVHEFSHALAAFRLGDSTARYMGRLTLDPRAHLDPLGAGILALGAVAGGIFVGWAKPTPVNPINLAGGRRGEALVALAGPASNLVMAALFAIPYRFISQDPEFVFRLGTLPAFLFSVLFFLVLINVFLCIFNLLPIPPLDGWKVLTGLVSPRTAYTLRQYEQYGFIALLLLFVIESQGRGPIGFLGRTLFEFLTAQSLFG
jgi:Zn-dependent protease